MFICPKPSRQDQSKACDNISLDHEAAQDLAERDQSAVQMCSCSWRCAPRGWLSSQLGAMPANAHCPPSRSLTEADTVVPPSRATTILVSQYYPSRSAYVSPCRSVCSEEHSQGEQGERQTLIVRCGQMSEKQPRGAQDTA